MNSRTTDETIRPLSMAIFSLDDATRAKLRRIANRNDMSMSQVVRHLVKKSTIVLPAERKKIR